MNEQTLKFRKLEISFTPNSSGGRATLECETLKVEGQRSDTSRATDC